VRAVERLRNPIEFRHPFQRSYVSCTRLNVSIGKKTALGSAICKITPNYWTQGEALDNLKDHLRDLYHDLTSGELPGIRKVGDLVVSGGESI
jgi:hypothetical protein